MIATFSNNFAGIGETKLCGINERAGVREYYEFQFSFDEGVIRTYNTQYRLDIDPSDPRFPDLLEKKIAMDPSRYANKRLGELRDVAQSQKQGLWVPPTFWAITSQPVEPDFAEIDRRTQEVLDNLRGVDAMRAKCSGAISVQADDIDNSVLIVTPEEEGARQEGIKIPVPASDIIVKEAVNYGEPLFQFSPCAGLAARNWVMKSIGKGSSTVINGQLAHDVDLIDSVPSEAYIWLDAKRTPRFFSMPAKYISRNTRLEVKSPHRASALRAAGIQTEQPFLRAA
jgi:hypothetical protein